MKTPYLKVGVNRERFQFLTLSSLSFYVVTLLSSLLLCVVYTLSVDIHMSDRDTSSRGGHARLHVSLSRDHTCKHVVASSL